jgi:hypothetical protein
VTDAPPASHTALRSYRSDVHSQHGEDGVLAEVFDRLESSTELSRWCVEFGAWDGLHLSNTANLVLHRGWRAVLIEPVAERCAEIPRNLPADRVTALCSSVGLEPPNRLDDLLASTGIPEDLDLLSIDIDGDDLHVLRSVRRYRPKVVCIEYNFTIPNDVHYEQPLGAGVAHGSSASAIVSAAGELGYVLAEVTDSNLVLVRSDLADAVLGRVRPTLDELRDDRAARCFLFVGYDGTVLTSDPVQLPWHRVVVRPRDLQVLPARLRTFPGSTTRLQRLGMAVWLSVHDRAEFRRWWAVRWSARTARFRRAPGHSAD